MIPFPVILTELTFALGLALFGANALAWLRLRREQNWPPRRASRALRAGATATLPSRGRILAGMVIGLVVTLWAAATFVTLGYSL